MTILIIVVTATILISASCSLFEAVLYSSRTTTLASAAKSNGRSRVAQQMLELKKNISQPIAAILILNTIANTAGATVAGMLAAETLGHQWLPVFSTILTLGILFFSEIMPKTIGAVRWRSIWPLVVFPLRVIKVGLYPMIYLTEKFTTLITKGHTPVTVTEDEILAMVHMGAAAGEISKEEGKIVQNIIKMEDKRVRDIMTPRMVIFSLDADMPVGKAARLIEEQGYSRIPIYEEDEENIIGYVLAKEINSPKVQATPDAPLRKFAKKITFVPETVNCLTLLTRFLKHRLHLAIVVDEYGGVDGLVTLEDLMETMLGTEIVDETDDVEDLQEVARRRAARRGVQGEE